MEKRFKLTKAACYLSYISQAAVIVMSPLLFETFHEQYGVSYTRLGLLVLVNFFSQLVIDLIFSFFSQRFNLALTVRITPLITIAGFLVYGVMPLVFPGSAYLWITVGTVVFSVSSGLCEVLLSPTVAALPSDDPGREMSRFHSVYAWGVVFVVVVSSFYLKFFGRDKWQYLPLVFAMFSVVTAILFFMGKMPDMSGSNEETGKSGTGAIKKILPFAACIFLGSCAENTMSQWCSGFVETGLGFSKFYGDLLGTALFALTLGLARTLYGRFGRKIYNVLLAGFIGASVCYLMAGLVGTPAVCLAACVLCGLSTSMLWPGTLIWTEEVYPGCGVVIYALLAAAGDCGASFAPQLMGVVTDKIAVSRYAESLFEATGAMPDSTGMRGGMLLTAIFPLIGVLVVFFMRRKYVGHESRLKK